jgi:hypothetical protein
VKALIALLAVLVSLAVVPAKAASLSDQVHEVLSVVFQSIGADKTGMVQPRDLDDMVSKTYGAMDVNQDGRVTLDEFKAFSMGFEYLAQVRGKLASFNAAKTAIFRRWDTSKTGYLTFEDYRAGVLGDLTRSANRSNTGNFQLSLDELRRAGFIRELIQAIQ